MESDTSLVDSAAVGSEVPVEIRGETSFEFQLELDPFLGVSTRTRLDSNFF